MTYEDYIGEVSNTVIKSTNDGYMYLIPNYRYVIRNMKHHIDEIVDFEGITYEDVYEDLKTFIQLNNRRANYKMQDVIDWLYDIIVYGKNEALPKEELLMLKNVTEYLNAKKEGKRDIDSMFGDIDFEKKDL